MSSDNRLCSLGAQPKMALPHPTNHQTKPALFHQVHPSLQSGPSKARKAGDSTFKTSCHNSTAAWSHLQSSAELSDQESLPQHRHDLSSPHALQCERFSSTIPSRFLGQ